MISFVTAIKIGPGYETYTNHLRMYLENITHCLYTYEIIIVEEQSSNTLYLHDVFTHDELKRYHAQIIPYIDEYPNPYGYPMIEAFAKNIGIRHAQYPFICVTNVDILFGDFDFVPHLKPKHFYRFVQYEIPIPYTWTYSSQLYTTSKCLNPLLKTIEKCSLQDIAYKSGDCMILDRDTWEIIKGFPENTVWTHSDYIVCNIVNNNRLPLVIPSSPIYTYEQPAKDRVLSYEEINIVKSYEFRYACN